MGETMDDIMHPQRQGRPADFPDAPPGWTGEKAQGVAREEGLKLTADHWETVRALHAYYQRQGGVNGVKVRELHDALDEKFHAKGGIRYVYQLFPQGPIAQGCRIAGLEPPPGAVDKGFGSVV